MPRVLDPKDIAFPWALRRGALILLPDVAPGAGGKAAAQGAPKVMRFQYNPESITRSRQGEWEPRKNQKAPAQKAKAPTPSQKADQDSFQGGGLFTKSETIQMKLVFDATELLLREPGAAETGGADPTKVGILPELAVLEQIAVAEPPKDEEKSKGKKGDKLNVIRPKELLLVLGPRYFPVIITSMTITEKRFSPELIPLRAEVDLQMQVLEATETSGDQAIQAAFTQLMAERRRHAKIATADISLQVKDGSLSDVNQAIEGAIAAALRPGSKGGT